MEMHHFYSPRQRRRPGDYVLHPDFPRRANQRARACARAAAFVAHEVVYQGAPTIAAARRQRQASGVSHGGDGPRAQAHAAAAHAGSRLELVAAGRRVGLALRAVAGGTVRGARGGLTRAGHQVRLRVAVDQQVSRSSSAGPRGPTACSQHPRRAPGCRRCRAAAALRCRRCHWRWPSLAAGGGGARGAPSCGSVRGLPCCCGTLGGSIFQGF